MAQRNVAPSIAWQAPEYEPRERSTDWFWAVGIISIGLAVASIIMGNLLFGILIILASFTLSMFAARPPEILDVVIDEMGIRVGDRLYPYKGLESFWIETEGDQKILVKSQKLLMPYIVVPIPDGELDIEAIHRLLSAHIPEAFHAESPLEKILERLGF
jgi:hypothetical protein